MESEEQIEERAGAAAPSVESPALRVVGALERIRPLPRQSALARIITRGVAQHRLEQDELKAERALLQFKSGALQSRIGDALGLGESNNAGSKDAPRLFSRASSANSESARPKSIRISGSYAIGPRTVLDSLVEGTRVDLMQLRMRVVHHPPILGDFENGRVSLTAATDLDKRHRVTLESMMGCDDDRHSLSNVVSTDFTSAPAWGVGTSHKLGKKLTLFSRYSSDQSSGRRVILQAVQTCGRNTISPICSVASKGRIQAGITWKSCFPSKASSKQRGEDFFQLKALVNRSGAFSIFLKAQFGKPVDPAEM